MDALDGVRIDVPSWGAFQPRKDIENPRWFRLNNDLFGHQDFCDFDPPHFVVWVYILSQASKHGVPFTLRPRHVMMTTRCSEADLKDALIKLEQIQCITVDVTPTLRPRTEVCSTEQDKTEQRRESTEQKTGTNLSAKADPQPALAQIWNEHSGVLPKIRGCSASRKRHAASRWREKPDKDYWVSVVQKLAQSSFCTGKNDRAWIATFDFLLQPETHNKVMEGKYDDKTEVRKVTIL